MSSGSSPLVMAIPLMLIFFCSEGKRLDSADLLDRFGDAGSGFKSSTKLTSECVCVFSSVKHHTRYDKHNERDI